MTIFSRIWLISINITIYWIISLKNDHSMKDFMFLATFRSTDGIFRDSDYWKFTFLNFRWLSWIDHLQVMNSENDPKWPIFYQNWSKLGQKWPFFLTICWCFSPFNDNILWKNVKKQRKTWNCLIYESKNGHFWAKNRQFWLFWPSKIGNFGGQNCRFWPKIAHFLAFLDP